MATKSRSNERLHASQLATAMGLAAIGRRRSKTMDSARSLLSPVIVATLRAAVQSLRVCGRWQVTTE